MTRETEWINDYTALILTQDTHYEIGDTITVESRPIQPNTLWQTLKLKLAKFFTPNYRHYSVHLEHNTLDAEIIDSNPEQNTYIAEVTTPTLKHYPTRQNSIGYRIRNK